MDSDEDDFGPTVPPLSVFIKGILQKYPDGCQLKELLQNAEDAGATTVKFLHDRNSYSRNTLFQSNLGGCQGPALCAYNNAQFQACDWKGIQQPQRSHKADSVLKVGKFGIGFNSVYHLTDTPWILSGDKLAVMEPTESLFNGSIRGIVKHRSGFDWKLNKETHRNEIRTRLDQFVPIETDAKTMNGVGFWQNWRFDGTMFRLPFRIAPSVLSTTVYNESMVENLFDGFSSEMEETLLFLSHLETIEIWNSQRSAAATSRVSISPNSIATMRSLRAKLIQDVDKIVELRKSGVQIKSDLAVNMLFNIDKMRKSKTWIVSHFIPKHSNAPTSWSLESEVKRLPWVSLAAQVQTTVEGRIFCFLPLPNNPENMTGLPVHVNAYFGLEDNRRNLKWPSADQTRDNDAKWNAALVEEVVPIAYVQLICFCIDNYGEESYKLWPDIDKVHKRWKPILAPFFKLLFALPVLKISSGGTWAYLNTSVYVDNLSQYNEEKIAEAIRRCFNLSNTPYVTAPDNVLKAVNTYGDRKQIIYTDYQVVYTELRKLHSWNNIGNGDRLLLLQYFVEKCGSSAVSFIKNFPIIPLVSGDFATLTSNNLYLATKTYETLLPTLRNSIININALPDVVISWLNNFAGTTVMTINTHNFPAILKNVLPNTWKVCTPISFNLNTTSFPNKAWLQLLWRHLQETYPRDLSQFENLTLLDCPKNGWALLSLPPRLASLLFVENSFSTSIENLLTDANAIAVPAKLLKLHVHLSNYIHKGLVSSLTELLQNCNPSSVANILKSNSRYRNELVSFFARHIDEITSAGRKMIRNLPIFEVLRLPNNQMMISNVTSIAERANAAAVDFDGLPALVQPSVPYLDCRNADLNKIRKWLGIGAITREEISQKIVENRNSYKSNDFSSLMLWAFDYIQPWTVRSSLMNHCFVPSDDGRYYAPSALFDPHVACLQGLFYGELSRFPVGNYNNSKTLDILRGLGLRTTADLTGDEIMQTARYIHSTGLINQTKLIYFNQVLQANFLKLSSYQIAEIKNLKLFQAKINRPPEYPQQLYWFGSANQGVLYSAVELAQHDCALIVGSGRPILDTVLPVQLGFADRSNVSLEFIVNHLHYVSVNYKALNKFEQESILYQCYTVLAERPFAEVVAPLIYNGNFILWVWTGKKFVKPAEVVTNWTYYQTGLEPYMYCLPNFLQENKLIKFFRASGVQEDDKLIVGRKVFNEIVRKYETTMVRNQTEIKIDFNYVRSILEVLAENLDGNEVKIPIKHSSIGLKFKPSQQCKYNDSGNYEALLMEVDDEEDEIILAHSDLPNELCATLGVTPLSSAVMDAEEFEQHESILQRLKNILEEYPADATIFQELIQNADDARAKQVGFLLDMRENTKYRRSVLYKEFGKMDKFQGPALWVFNDATFSDEDFKNILSVGGATKRNQSEKIGSFGVGFNSVYHLTDMPCFVSRQYLAILDPHKQCLPRTGGVKVNLEKKPRKLEAFADQFLPYKGVYGCDLSYKPGGVDYMNTLFRLPLRDSEMQNNSQLNKTSYDFFKMQTLLKGFGQTANYVMLFLRNVKTLQVDYLPSNCNDPRNKQMLLDVKKTTTPLPNADMGQNDLIQTVKTYIDTRQRFRSLHYAEIAEITIASPSEPFSICQTSGVSNGVWILQWSASNDTAYQLASSVEGQAAGLMPVVAIAASIQNADNKFDVVATSGLAFCYLPLPVETGLPFHLHAAFGLAANRRHLWADRDTSSLKSRWNEALKSETLVTCLIELLAKLKCLDEENFFGRYKFYNFWPIYGNVQHEFLGFVKSVYQQLCTSDKCLWKTEDGRWITFAQSRFLKISNLWSPGFVQAAKRATMSLLHQIQPDTGLVVISSEVQNSLETLFVNEFGVKSYDDENFFAKIFFPCIQLYDSELANEILLEVLNNAQAQKQYLKKLLQDTPCIPVGPDGNHRVRPSDLVHTQTEIHKLYFENENKFAFGPFKTPQIQKLLIAFGMRTTASSEMLLERANTIQTLFEQGLIEDAKIRSKLILNSLTGPHILDSAYDKFLNIPFLFALSQPQDWTLPWLKVEHRVYCPQEVYFKNSTNAVCFVAPILDSEGLTNAQELAYQLGCRRNIPSPRLILEQLRILSSLSPIECTTRQVDVMQEIVSECYKTLHIALKTKTVYAQLEPLIEDFSTLPILLLKPAAFVPYPYACIDATQENYAPYLYSIKGTTYDKYADLLLKFGVKQAFSIDDYIDALQRMNEKYHSNPLTSDLLQIAVHLCKNISDSLDDSSTNQLTNLLVPDEKGILLKVSELTFWELDMKEIPEGLMAGANFCNRKIPRDIALKLGVRLQRSMIAEKFYHPFGESFGQHEELTTRISNILDEYSSKSDVINEMIQNADDAGATEIRFILDKRQLRTDSNLLSDNWKHLQGPSLIVYNNKPFEEKDFKGIADLGLGSKRDQAHLTGKFGIGFNTVYHLTDVPMFISDNSILCVLDPHELYVPTATAKSPGGKFELHEDFKATYASILMGFQPVHDLQFEKSTVFRLPLRKRGEMSSKIADPIELKELTEMFKTFESCAADYFFFLKSVGKIRISHVDQNGEMTKDLSFFSEMSREDTDKKEEFFKILKSKEVRAEDATVKYRIRVSSDMKSAKYNEPEKFKWQILQRLSCMKDELPPEVVKLRETGKLTASPLVGIAMPLHASSNTKRTYTTLPMPGYNKLPIHVNGKFMLDQGRKQIFLDGDGSYKKQWNEYLLTKVLAPLYIEALEIVKNSVNSEWEKTHSNQGADIRYQQVLIKRYQRYLPTTSNQQPIGQLLLKEIYNLLHKNNLELTFGVKIDYYQRRNLMWLSTSEGIIDTLVEKEEPKQPTVILSTGVTTRVATVQKKDDKPTEIDHIRSLLEIVHFPKYHLGFNYVMYEICRTVEMAPNLISPTSVAEHMKNVEDKLILRPGGETLPVNLENTVLNGYMIRFCLNYILEAEKVELENIPLLLTADHTLRRFSAAYEVYGAENTELLPSQGNLFCSWQVNSSKIPEKYCRKFDVAILADHLDEELPDLFGKCQRKPLSSNMNLIFKILKYLAKDSNDRKSLLTRLQPLQDWALLPATVRNAQENPKNFLVTLRNASIVVVPVGGSAKLNELYCCLRKLGVIFAEVGSFLKPYSEDIFSSALNSTLIEFFSNLCACAQAPETIVNVLYSASKNEVQEANFDRLNTMDRKVLLDFIIESFSHSIEADETHIMTMIKSLPLFQTLEGNFVNLEADCSYIVCKEKIEGAELDKLKDLMKAVLLSTKFDEHEIFCKNLNISVMSKIDLYAQYIIPNLAKFTMKSVWKHLTCLSYLLFGKERDEVYKQLGRTPFMRMDSGNFKAISDLYDDGVKKEFESMLPEDSFLPEAFCKLLNEAKADSPHWNNFLTNVGLKYELSADVFLCLARNLETEDSTNETLEFKSKILVNYLNMHKGSMMNKFGSFLNQVSSIKFIYTHVVSEDLGYLHQQGPELKGLTCYQNSVLCRNERICWTVSKLLPDWSMGFSLSLSRLIKDLNYLEQPTIEDVITHAENICNHLQKLKFDEHTTTKINSGAAIELLDKVLEEIFNFLKDKLDQKQDLVEKLKKVPCVLVDDGRVLVCPNQVVFQSTDIDECPPFLYNLPEQLMSFIGVLQKIGTEKLVTHRHYSSALKMFYTTYGKGPIRDPNIKTSLRNAYVGFLQKLIQNESNLPVIEEELYLPDQNFCLVKSTQIIVLVEDVDDVSLANMQGKKWNTAMITNMDVPIEKCANVLLSLPTLIRPISYEHFITKTLSNSCERCDGADFCKDKYDIQRLFNDPMFVLVVTKVINCHSLHAEGREAKQDEMAAFFNDVAVTCYSVLRIAKREIESAKLIEEKSVATFWCKTKSNTVDFMVAHEHTDMNNSFVDNLVALVNLVCPFKTTYTEHHFRSIFDKLNLYRQKESLEEIAKRELKVGDVDDDCRPQLGSVVPDDMIALLDQNPFNYYKPHEYIAFPPKQETDDQNIDIYIFGLIIEKIEETDDDGSLKCRYVVDVGGVKPVEKKALDIYKFISNKQVKREIAKKMALNSSDLLHDFNEQVKREIEREMALVCSDNLEESEGIDRLSRPMQEIMNEISDQVEEIWRLPPEDRRRAIRRLYLLWHPDKHPPHRKEICEEACKFLQSEVHRMENGLPRKKREETKPSPFWNDNFGRWNHRARRDRNRRETYNSRAEANWGYFSAPRKSDVPPSFAKNLNPAAKLWCQQAKHDLDAASNEAVCTEPSVEWVFYKCYQVARKCLIALLFTKSTFENQNTNLMELTMDVLEAFGDDPGEVYNSVKFLVSKEVDEVRPLKPLCGQTNHQNYLQYRDCAQEVLEAAKKLLTVAQCCTERSESEE